ncbi:hypothetical protein BCR32DRAFT_273306 [Anaeromyces robustus]|uniref:SprT-like domain-containing protein n=1 Tax=Anaeromyces robustus TaxID=1754192 RepID=A0A1Y1VRD8_9FUNG|nr:hypothetical protein BCR32DRAFT_273306 [Anaeromyces robustus]|eukprot:ORX63861.1 hypothetical protein BCR32DRAFT_273306 [Anaeromyces robustus]
MGLTNNKNKSLQIQYDSYIAKRLQEEERLRYEKLKKLEQDDFEFAKKLQEEENSLATNSTSAIPNQKSLIDLTNIKEEKNNNIKSNNINTNTNIPLNNCNNNSISNNNKKRKIITIGKEENYSSPNKKRQIETKNNFIQVKKSPIPSPKKFISLPSPTKTKSISLNSNSNNIKNIPVQKSPIPSQKKFISLPSPTKSISSNSNSNNIKKEIKNIKQVGLIHNSNSLKRPNISNDTIKLVEPEKKKIKINGNVIKKDNKKSFGKNEISNFNLNHRPKKENSNSILNEIKAQLIDNENKKIESSGNYSSYNKINKTNIMNNNNNIIKKPIPSMTNVTKNNNFSKKDILTNFRNNKPRITNAVNAIINSNFTPLNQLLSDKNNNKNINNNISNINNKSNTNFNNIINNTSSSSIQNNNNNNNNNEIIILKDINKASKAIDELTNELLIEQLQREEIIFNSLGNNPFLPPKSSDQNNSKEKSSLDKVQLLILEQERLLQEYNRMRKGKDEEKDEEKSLILRSKGKGKGSIKGKGDTSLQKFNIRNINELDDPCPDLHQLFLLFNAQYFHHKLDSVEVRWSKKMTLCAGICYYYPGGYCSVRLSEPLLKFRTRDDFINTLLHEMIHAYLFLTEGNRDHDGHGESFHRIMYKLNKETGSNITVYHNFHNEVNHYRTHVWRCNGPCRFRPPFFGYVRRSMNRKPQKADSWWRQHQATCGGEFIKISEPEEYTKKRLKKKGGTVDKALINQPSTSNVDNYNRLRNINTIFNNNKSNNTNKNKNNNNNKIIGSNSSTTSITATKRLNDPKMKNINNRNINNINTINTIKYIN